MRVDEMDDETRSLGNFAKSHTKYGSTSRNVLGLQKLIKHTLSPSDTLQGLALKYGVSMENIKRTNKIWTNDSIFLRKSLDIPIIEKLDSFTSGTNNGHSNEEVNTLENPSTSDQSVSDLFGRIDCLIAQSKDKMKSMQQSTVCSALDPTAAPSSPSARGASRRKNKFRYTNSQTSLSQDEETDLLMTTPTVVTMTQGNKVKHSLKKLQQQQDEIFEL